MLLGHALHTLLNKGSQTMRQKFAMNQGGGGGGGGGQMLKSQKLHRFSFSLVNLFDMFGTF